MNGVGVACIPFFPPQNQILPVYCRIGLDPLWELCAPGQNEMIMPVTWAYADLFFKVQYFFPSSNFFLGPILSESWIYHYHENEIKIIVNFLSKSWLNFFSALIFFWSSILLFPNCNFFGTFFELKLISLSIS